MTTEYKNVIYQGLIPGAHTAVYVDRDPAISTTPYLLGEAGPKTFILNKTMPFVHLQTVRFWSIANPSNTFNAQVDSIDGITLVCYPLSYSGSGTYDDWYVAVDAKKIWFNSLNLELWEESVAFYTGQSGYSVVEYSGSLAWKASPADEFDPIDDDEPKYQLDMNRPTGTKNTEKNGTFHPSGFSPDYFKDTRILDLYTYYSESSPAGWYLIILQEIDGGIEQIEELITLASTRSYIRRNVPATVIYNEAVCTYVVSVYDYSEPKNTKNGYFCSLPFLLSGGNSQNFTELPNATRR